MCVDCLSLDRHHTGGVVPVGYLDCSLTALSGRTCCGASGALKLLALPFPLGWPRNAQERSVNSHWPGQDIMQSLLCWSPSSTATWLSQTDTVFIDLHGSQTPSWTKLVSSRLKLHNSLTIPQWPLRRLSEVNSDWLRKAEFCLIPAHASALPQAISAISSKFQALALFLQCDAVRVGIAIYRSLFPNFMCTATFSRL